MMNSDSNVELCRMQRMLSRPENIRHTGLSMQQMVLYSSRTSFVKLRPIPRRTPPAVTLQRPQSEGGPPMVELQKPRFDAAAFLASVGLGVCRG
jgi:hypothetical protein